MRDWPNEICRVLPRLRNTCLQVKGRLVPRGIQNGPASEVLDECQGVRDSAA
ncbi:hypothetical protein DPMN_123244 [Dreissena polymorpha]|uniref:Uncharacterized protein n=1 Tax=Dreissena polymorpha TaxID=45954 RepID=A0A9D4JR38_DREPO|nr:hypothetical protein DPMN_123244 [Dreissena polymorpha]